MTVSYRALAPVLALAGSLALSACNDEAAPEPTPVADACGASGYSDLVGQPESAATGIPHDGAVRIIRPGMAVTMEFNPERLNFEIGDDGTIVRVYCG